ncbi:DUF1294 domain-containing protein [Carnobacterium gallinarum]|uniref:DUF1294 domain-containing protein n=1 Tax=Carnobacterium gallinarum TaxID=2749 RepID=UPI00055324B7|nr:DUF1294 domain-containing protein [Carnobacterium gallinarum]
MSDLLLACIYFLAINILLFILMGLDKYRAKKRLWRIPEKTLLSFGILGGGLGGLVGMLIFHHKIRVLKFKVIYFLGTIVMSSILYCLIF